MSRIINGMDNMRIVIVEDEAAIREGLTDMINNHTRFQVVGVGKNGLEGLNVIERERPDCIITDIRMGEMSGLEMLQKLHDKNIRPYSIILSGYSDFEYAREGLRLGVDEYLLKPVSIDMLQKTLDKIEEKLMENRNAKGYQLTSDMRIYLFGAKEESGIAAKRLFTMLGEQQKSIVLTGYYANIKKNYDVLERQIKSFKRQCGDITCMDVTDRTQNMYVMVLIGKETALTEALRKFEDIVVANIQLQNYEIPWACTIPEIVSGSQWRDVFFEEKKLLAASISQRKKGILYTHSGTGEEKKIFEYPQNLEKKILRELGNSNKEEAYKYLDEFLDVILKEQYEAEDIHRGVLKLLTQMVETAKEINQKAYEILRTQNSMQNVLNAYTRKELFDTLADVSNVICDKDKKDGISNYIINRTLEYIRMHFKEGITLEETAEMMNITPEYLSMLFKREMGMNFSVFLRKFRISYAKRLLKGTDMKVYEVAQECGYVNSNYFTRVFKEETGISPAEYH